jgi:hypothetical protein
MLLPPVPALLMVVVTPVWVSSSVPALRFAVEVVPLSVRAVGLAELVITS